MASRSERRKVERLVKALADVGLNGAVAPPEVRHMPPTAAVEAFLEATEGSVSPHTNRGRQRVARNFARWADARHVESMAAIAQQEAEAWVDWRTGHIKATSLNTEISYVQAFVTWCWRQRLMADRIDLHDARPRGAKNGRSEPLLTRDARAALAKFPDDPDRLAVELLATTGLRIGELVGLPAGAWRPERGILHLEGASATKNHERDLPLGRRMAERVRRHLEGLQEPAGAFWQPPMTAGRLAKRLTRRTGINPHRLRKHWYTFLIFRACPTPITDYLMGHTLRDVDAAYIDHHEVEAEREWMQRLEDALLE